jgi:SAM-dependent methyltransferase
VTLFDRLTGVRWLQSGPSGWWPRVYEGFFTRTRWGRSLRDVEARPIVEALRAHGVEGRRVLEIGAGTGAYTDLLVRSGARVEVREPSPSMRRYLARRATREWWDSVEIGSGALPADLAAGSGFAVVLAVGVLNYVAELGEALDALARAVGPDGVIIVNVPTADRRAGSWYRAIEFLGRRRVHCRTRTQVETAARRAGLALDLGHRPAGVTDVYVLRPRQAAETC